eukprot:scaffold5393_cov156-Cylindrotheca_fusiformis.AAC.2
MLSSSKGRKRQTKIRLVVGSDQDHRKNKTKKFQCSSLALVILLLVLIVQGTTIQLMGTRNIWTSESVGGSIAALLELPLSSQQQQQILTTFELSNNNDDNNDLLFPPMQSSQCSAEQLQIISRQLPPDDCIKNQKQPWTSFCSFSRASSCPNHVWLEEVHSSTATSTTNNNNHNDNHQDDSFVSYFVGCNKAIDAVETLHLGSNHNPKYDANAWKQALIDSVPSKEGKKAFARSSCKQFERPLDKQQNATRLISSFRSANVYCFEPITATFQALRNAKMTMGWHNELILEQAAVGMETGTLLVPSNVQIGEEQKGIDNHQADCAKAVKNGGGIADGCLQVPVYTLDDYVTSLPQHGSNNKQIIHFLSIDVEGFDFQVLQGATSILTSQVEYLEFEYNWKGPWGKSSLRDAIDLLDEHGFTCYWPGAKGELWKITGCWLDHYRTHYWSNVACVNREMRGRARQLAAVECCYGIPSCAVYVRGKKRHAELYLDDASFYREKTDAFLSRVED